MNPRHLCTWLLAFLCGCVLCACGGSEDSKEARVRLLNATQNYGALDLYTTDTKRLSDVAQDVASDYFALGEGTHSFRFKPAGSSTTASSSSISLAKDTSYTLVAYNESSALRTAYFTDNESAPTSGTAKFRAFNGAIASGYVDIYVTAPGTDLASTSPTMSNLASSSLSSYTEIAQGTYRIRVTGYGDKSDLRLDIPSVALTDRQIVTFLIESTSGGVLVNALLVNQGGTVTAYKNANARVRVVAAVSGNAGVTARTTDNVLNASLQSPTVGAYVTTPASMSGLAVTVNGTTVDTSALSVTQGTDVSLLVYGDASAPQVKILLDDNTLPTASGNAKLRVVNLVNGLGSTLTLNADYVAVVDNVVFGAASTPASIAASTSMRLEVTSPVRTTPLYTATNASLGAQKVYSLFMLGDAAVPVGVLRKDR